MSYYVFFVGGTGAKVFEACLHDAAANVFSFPAAQPVHALLVDMDSNCGNLQRALQTHQQYEVIRENILSGQANCGFQTHFQLSQFTSVGALAIGQGLSANPALVPPGSDTEKITHLFYSQSEMDMNYSKGFLGKPNVGAAFFDIALPELVTGNPAHPFSQMVQSIRNDIGAGNVPRILLVGSVFGGTGASAIPCIARYLRSLTMAKGAPLPHNAMEIAVSLVLPYFKMTAANDANPKIRAEEFAAKTRAGLASYDKEGITKGNTPIFNEVYLIGTEEPALFPYSEGGEDQENPAHLVDLLAARSVYDYLAKDAVPAATDFMMYQMQVNNMTGRLEWSSFHNGGQMMTGYAGMLRSAYLFASAFAEPLSSDFATMKPGMFGHMGGMNNAITKRFFKNVTPEGLVNARRAFAAMGAYYRYWLQWFRGIIGTLPASMCRPPLADQLPLNELVHSPTLDQLTKFYTAIDFGSLVTSFPDTALFDLFVHAAPAVLANYTAIYNQMSAIPVCTARDGYENFSAFLSNLIQQCSQ